MTCPLKSLFALLFPLSLVATGPVFAQDKHDASVQLEVSEKEPYGAYLTDSEGRSLYLFMSDSRNTSTCYDACAAAWPPLTTPEDVSTGDEMVQRDLLSTFQREDGTTQVQYGDWPLYYYIQDEQPGDTTGQDVKGFGAEWYLVRPDGNKVTSEEHEH